MTRVLLDGRVFSTAAFDRGMGRYTMHLLDLLRTDGHEVTVLLFRNCHLTPDHEVVTRHEIRFANYAPEGPERPLAVTAGEMHEFTAYLSALIEAEGYGAYVDATPFLGPSRLDLFGCPVVGVCYDFIPLKHPDFYLGSRQARQIYYNGLARLAKADHVVCISETTEAEAKRYLAVPPERLTVVSPTLEPRYHEQPAPPADGEPYMFAILGSHKSKNPVGSLKVYQQLLDHSRLTIRLNVPKNDQLRILQANEKIPSGVVVTASVTDDEKFALQANAVVVAHLSLEEGFGIPLLEALFLGRKVIALDIRINRQFFNRVPAGLGGAVFLLSPFDHAVDPEAFTRFLGTDADPAFFAAIRQAYIAHWAASPALMTAALDRAAAEFAAWGQAVQAKIFSSIPGTSCGVADYSMAYARSAAGNVMFFFSEGEQENLSWLGNLRAGSYLDFDRFSRSRFATVPGFYNFAFSPALHPGIGFMRTNAKPGDVVMIHERRYFDGLRAEQVNAGGVAELLLEYGGAESAQDRSALARDCAFHHSFNEANPAPAIGAPISGAWLKSLPLRAISHLPPAVLREMEREATAAPGIVVNDLAALEDRLDYIPLGIDDRRHPALRRAAQRLRVRRMVQQDDVVVGHFGLILNDLKRLSVVVDGFLEHAVRREREMMDNRRLFFFLVGKVVDRDLFRSICQRFAAAGLGDRLIHANPAQEVDFDAEIAACDAVACFRVQTRGQLSHVFVRALSLGTPVLVNQRSGYGYDPRTTIADDAVAAGLGVAIERLFDPAELTGMRHRARREYQATHRGDDSLRSILRSEAT